MLLLAFTDFEHERPPWPLSVTLQVVWHIRSVAHAKGWELLRSFRAVLLGVIGEDCDSVEWAVLLREVEPALEAVGALSSDAQTNNVRARVKQTIDGVVGKLWPARELAHDIQWDGREQSLVLDSAPALQGDDLGILIQLDHLHLRSILLLLLWEELSDAFPDRPSASLLWESEDGIGSPVAFFLVEENIADRFAHIDGSNTLSEPSTLHVWRGNGPHLVVVWPHEDVCDTISHHSQNPLVKVLGLLLSSSHANFRFNKSLQASDLVFHRKGTDVVLEWVSNPPVLDPHVRDTLHCIPVVVANANGSVNQLVEVLVVAEDHMATHIEKEAFGSYVRTRQATRFIKLVNEQPVIISELVQSRGTSKASWSCSNNQNTNLFSLSILRHPLLSPFVVRSLSCRTASSRLNALEMKTRSERHSREKVVVRDQKRNVRRPRLQKPENCPSTS
mmetsp:Transcript_10143/g.27656  ORF Transcript_10143/g.27656 Transcript_10143/m.27656 type:complete len:447 (+) Transcript_10143:428-1768(+)